MAIHVKNKINSRLKFLNRSNRLLISPLRRLLCNAMTQPFFDYAYNARKSKVMNFAFVNIFDLNNLSFGVDNVKTVNSTYSLKIMAADI